MCDPPRQPYLSYISYQASELFRAQDFRIYKLRLNYRVKVR